ncbi:hypothetical protein ACJ3XI_05255 [Litorimonas sp. RW-G-Af-16]|uniref:hypothetical protein n=1 Tax=Litorimonas sp. RW-G-Af-16 TaxID=3241168 RepID=UPI00390C7454
MKPNLVICLFATGLLSACSTVKLPDFSMKNLAEFKDAKLDGDYPDVADAPTPPVDERSDAAWDKAASDLIALRSGFDVPSDDGLLDPTQIDAEFARLKSEAQAYKLDDPVGGIN